MFFLEHVEVCRGSQIALVHESTHAQPSDLTCALRRKVHDHRAKRIVPHLPFWTKSKRTWIVRRPEDLEHFVMGHAPSKRIEFRCEDTLFRVHCRNCGWPRIDNRPDCNEASQRD
jgi:hypothetical protein